MSSSSVHEADRAWLRSYNQGRSDLGPRGTAIEAGGDKLMDRGGLSRALTEGPRQCLAPLSQDRAAGLPAGPAPAIPGAPIPGAPIPGARWYLLWGRARSSPPLAACGRSWDGSCPSPGESGRGRDPGE